MNRRLQRLWASLLPSSGPRLPVIDFKRPHTCTQCITVLEWAAGLLERCDKQIFQPRREVWPSNPSGLAKVLLFLLRPFSSCFEYIWQFVILKKSDLDWGSNRDRLRALIGFNCTMSTWHVSSKSACASMDTDWTQTGHRLDTDSIWLPMATPPCSVSLSHRGLRLPLDITDLPLEEERTESDTMERMGRVQTNKSQTQL